MSNIFDVLLECQGLSEKKLKDDMKILTGNLIMSSEQQKIIDNIANHNIIVDAVAGSGKTSTVIGLAIQSSKRILQITYNAALKFEVREKSHGLFTVETYHSLGFNNYGFGKNDEELLKIFDRKIKTKKCYDIIVIDEAQDMTQLYFRVITKFMHDINFKGKLLIMGDTQQAINAFNGADARYLTDFDKISRLPFIRLQLNTSFRLTENTAKFVSLAAKREINTTKFGNRVKYIHEHSAFINKYLFSLILHYEPKDVFVLMPSVKNATHSSRELEHMLVDAKIPCFVSVTDDKIDSSVYANKIIFTTMNQSKGRERKLVIIYNFDDSYYCYDKKSRNDCSNLHYVAMTRATEQLVLCHEYGNNQLNFIDLSPVEFIGIPTTFISKSSPPTIYSKTVEDFVKYIKNIDLQIIIDEISFIETKPINDIELPSTISFDTTNETVLTIAGNAILEYWYNKNGFSMFKNMSIDYIHDNLLQLSIEYLSNTTNIKNPLLQITNVDWLTSEKLEEFSLNINVNIKEYRKSINKHIEYFDKKPYKINLTATVDFTCDEVYMIICAEEITFNHMLQMLVISTMCDKKIYKIINAKNGVIRTINFGNVEKIMNLLIINIIHPTIIENDVEFISKHLS